MSNKDYIKMPNSGYEAEIGRTADGDFQLVLRDLKRSGSHVASQEDKQVIADATQKAEKAQANPSDSGAQYEAAAAVKAAADKGLIDKESFEELLKNSKSFKEAQENISGLKDDVDDIYTVLPTNEKGELVFIDTHVKQFVGEVRNVSPSSLQFSTVRYSCALFVTWLIIFLVVVFIAEWGIFNAAIYGLLSGCVVGLGFAFINKQSDSDDH